MPRPDDEWFRRQRIDGLIGPVDAVLAKIESVRRAAARCEQIATQADPRNDVEQRKNLREVSTMLGQFIDHAEAGIIELRKEIDLLGDPVLRSRGLSALRLMSDELNLEEIPSAESFMEEFERRLLRNRQADKIRLSRNPVARAQLAMEQADRTPLQHLRPSPEQIYAVPERRQSEHEPHPRKLVESPITIVERTTATRTAPTAPVTPSQTSTTGKDAAEQVPVAAAETSTTESIAPRKREDKTVNRFSLLDIDWED